MTASAHLSLTESRIALSADASRRALAVAEGGLDRGVEIIATAYESGTPPADSVTLVAGDSLDGFLYSVHGQMRREPPSGDLNGNGRRGEVVRYDRSWGYGGASLPGGESASGEPVRILTSLAIGRLARQELLLEVAFERNPAVADPSARGAWKAIRLRWSSLDDE
jgi:hypothetical protein